MSFLQRLFGSARPERDNPAMRFGRYSDAYKPDEKYDHWDEAIAKFERGDYHEAYDHFFNYLTDESQDNVKTWDEDGVLHFELLQGSKTIAGSVSQDMITAEAKVARAESLSIGFLRRMMEQNFSLKYGRYALDQSDNLTLVFDSYLIDGSPFKLYYALKELAVHADKQDDLLIAEFEMLKPINTGHLADLSDDEKSIKIQFLKHKITDTLHEIDNGKLNADQYPGGIGYLLLDLVYRLDYLVNPQGETTEAFERIHRIYFAADGKSPVEKNVHVRKEFEKILAKSDEVLAAELYAVSSSFGITNPSSQEELNTFIDGEIHNMDWYVENRHQRVAMAIPGYIAGYGLFNYAFPPPVQDLLHLFYRITERQFFHDLGFKPDYVETTTNALDQKAIRQALDRIEARHRGKYHKLKLDERLLEFATLPSFGKSFFLMIRGLDLTKKP